MTEPLPRTQDEHDIRAFEEYIGAMRSSVGQRFVKNLLQDAGYDAFEEFWKKLRDARYAEEPQIDLNNAEKNALAKAIHASSRRDFGRIALGLGLCVGSALLGRSALADMHENRNRYRPMDFGEGMGFCLKLGGAVLSGIFGLALAFKDKAPSEQQIADIATGEDGKKNVAKLVETLDALFKPIELSLTETGVRRAL